MFTITGLEKEGESIAGRTVFIDADVVAYYASYPFDELPLKAATRRADQRMEQIISECQAESYKGFLTGNNNFRNYVATLQRYKGNRYDKDGKRITNQPVWLQEVRQYLINEWDCILVEGQEADDALGIAQMATEDSIISSIDKDLWIIPGLHHDMNSGEIINVDEFGFINLHKGKLKGVGLKFFYAQMLMGDTTDWIKGLPKITDEMKELYPNLRKGGCGPTAAYKILVDAETKEECLDRVIQLYNIYWKVHSYKHWRTGKEYPAGSDTALHQIIEQGRLLWMRQKEEEMWEPGK